MKISLLKAGCITSIAFLVACSSNTTQKQDEHTQHQTPTSADTHQHHQEHNTHQADTTNKAPHRAEYLTAMNAMHDDMMVATDEKDPDVSFAKGMIPHHQGAIDMVDIHLKYAQDPEIRKLAEQIKAAQQPEIDMMNQWLKQHNTIVTTGELPHIKAYKDGMHSHHEMFSAIENNDPEIAFVKGMIYHHQGAIDMANIQLQYGQDETMRQLAKNIIHSQQPEVDFMKQWLQKKGIE